MLNLKETTHRRGFISTLTAGAAALGLASLAGPLRLAATPKLFHNAPDDSSFDMWLNKIKGKHRQIFDAPNHHDGMPFAWARVFQMTNSNLGTPENDLSTVIILRHDAIPMGMEDRLWEKYKFGEVFKLNDGATKAASVRNPFWNPKAGELPLPGMALNELLQSGVLVGVCDMALTIYSSKVAKDTNKDAAEVKKDWVAGVLPGIQIVPSGVLAVNRAQEHGCTYCYAG